ncbi:MAG: SdiA-regulated domain-containing protein [Ignavibacteriales bacterium]|nr:SdiA-regulated domain-containing protein [Ignavibacteriales bacterium]
MRSIIKNYATIVIIILIALTHYKCNTNRQESLTSLKLPLQKVTPIDVPEPSALTTSFDGKSFWSVGDSDSMVFKLDLDGKVIKSFLVNGEDLEGITVIDSTLLAVILERTREVVVLDTSGKEIRRKKFDLKGRLNEGLEGICYDVNTKNFYFVNEKRPGLMIKTDSSFAEIFRKELNLANDYSDLFYSKDDNTLWILSDESKKIIQTDLNGNKILEYLIDVEQPEGLVVDYKNKKVFIVSDKKEALYEFNLP